MPDAAPSNALELTVTELSNKLKRTVEDGFGSVRVRGELGRISKPASGHIYLDLKDGRSVLSGVVWKGNASRLKQKPQEGLEVIASGKLTTFPGQSKYQIVIDDIEPAGAGALMALLEERKRKLSAEGLFAEEAKQPLPFMPRVIGVVTSPSGAVIRDVLHRIRDRFPVHVIVWPVRVQGETSAAEVANGIHRLNQLPIGGETPRPDLIIVARGGGSLEDLWGFNDEAVVRAAAASEIPLISAIGHETDWTLLDLVADHRAPTPTAAAERAVPVRADLVAAAAAGGARLRGASSRLLDRRRTALRAASRGTASADSLLAIPRRAFDDAASRFDRILREGSARTRQRFDAAVARLSPISLVRRTGDARNRLVLARRDLGRALQATVSTRRPQVERFGERLSQAVDMGARDRRKALARISSRFTPSLLDRRGSEARPALLRASAAFDRAVGLDIAQRRERLHRSERLLDTLSYRSVLGRGFAVIRGEDGVPLQTAQALMPGTAVGIEMADGTRKAVIGGSPRSRTAKPGSREVATAAGKQGEMF